MGDVGSSIIYGTFFKLNGQTLISAYSVAFVNQVKTSCEGRIEPSHRHLRRRIKVLYLMLSATRRQGRTLI